MTLHGPSKHLSSFEWTLIRLLGRYARRLFQTDDPVEEIPTNTWYLYHRRNPVELVVDFTNEFWEQDEEARETYRTISEGLNTGELNIPVATLHLNDLLCLKMDRKYIELARHPNGWELRTIFERTQWDHWLTASGIISDQPSTALTYK